MTKKEVTNEKLARIIQKGFLEMNKKFDGVNDRIDGVNKRVNGFNDRITKVHKDLKADISGVDRKLTAEVERKDDIDVRIKEVRTRVAVLEKQVL